MTEINPLELEVGQRLVVSDRDSKYDGTKGEVLRIWEDEILLELDVAYATLVYRFDLDQLDETVV